jgi:hypothetical protein
MHSIQLDIGNMTVGADPRGLTYISHCGATHYHTTTRLTAEQCYALARAFIAEGDRQRNDARDNARLSDICEAMRLDEGASA